MDDIYFQVFNEDDELVAEIQVFSDMNSWWVSSDENHRIIMTVNNDDDDDYIDCYEEDFDNDVMEELYNERLEQTNDSLVDAMLDYLDKHNRNTGY